MVQRREDAVIRSSPPPQAVLLLRIPRTFVTCQVLKGHSELPWRSPLFVSQCRFDRNIKHALQRHAARALRYPSVIIPRSSWRVMRRIVLVAIVAAGIFGPASRSEAAITIAAGAGDVSSSGSGDNQTAALVPADAQVISLGDHQYPDGCLDAFNAN